MAELGGLAKAKNLLSVAQGRSLDELMLIKRVMAHAGRVRGAR